MTPAHQPHPQRYLTIDSCYDCSNRIEMVCLFKPLGMIPMPNGKEAFDYRNRYVCTEKDDREIDDDLPDWCPLPIHTSAPAPSTVVEDITFEGAAIVQAAKREAVKAAREQVLDAIDEWLNSDDHLSLYKWEVREKTRSLRNQPEPQQGAEQQ